MQIFLFPTSNIITQDSALKKFHFKKFYVRKNMIYSTTRLPDISCFYFLLFCVKNNLYFLLRLENKRFLKKDTSFEEKMFIYCIPLELFYVNPKQVNRNE